MSGEVAIKPQQALPARYVDTRLTLLHGLSCGCYQSHSLPCLCKSVLPICPWPLPCSLMID